MSLRVFRRPSLLMEKSGEHSVPLGRRDGNAPTAVPGAPSKSRKRARCYTPDRDAACKASDSRTNAAHQQERAIVAVRMRPLNSRESLGGGGGNRGGEQGLSSWTVLPGQSTIVQLMDDDHRRRPVPDKDRVVNRNCFQFDKAFDETTTTAHLYNSLARNVVKSVVRDGVNGTVFAYGQTSSGKTYTMQGDGGPTSGGIVQLAALDVFARIAADPTRVFLVRVSFVEVYNEELRDLLVSDDGRRKLPTLSVREDRSRGGVYVANATESIVTDVESLIAVLHRGGENRTVGSTAMNDKSSRSHTIFRITVESRKTWGCDDTNDDGGSSSSVEEVDENGGDVFNSSTSALRGSVLDDVDDDDGAVLVSTLNLVDLAGSESVRHTGATGRRLREGGKINQSLLTLSRVIVALGQPNSRHINFRDSKLTRILQTSLSGNARIAVICCATPSDLYLEETRSTLQFASRAMMVQTSAQVNEVLDDRSLIKRLQRDLAEARQSVGEGGGQKTVAEEKLRRLRKSILNSEIFDAMLATRQRSLSRRSSLNPDGECREGKSSRVSGDGGTSESQFERRHSDGSLYREEQDRKHWKTLKLSDGTEYTYAEEYLHEKNFANQFSGNAVVEHDVPSLTPVTVSTEADLLREALSTKSHLANSLKRLLETHRHDLVCASKEISNLKTSKATAEARVAKLVDDVERMNESQKRAIARKDKVITDIYRQLDTATQDNEAMEQMIGRYEHDATRLARERDVLLDNGTSLELKCDGFLREKEELAERLETLMDENQTLRYKIDSLGAAKMTTDRAVEQSKEENQHLTRSLMGARSENTILSAENAALTNAEATAKSVLNEKSTFVTEQDVTITRMEDDMASATNRICELSSAVETMKTTHKAALDASDEKLRSARRKISDLTTTHDELVDKIQTMEGDLSFLREHKDNLCSSAFEKDTLISSLRKQVESGAEERTFLEAEVSALQAKVEQRYKEVDKVSKELNDALTANEQVTGERDAVVEELASTRLAYATLAKDGEKADSEYRGRVIELERQTKRLEETLAACRSQLKEVEEDLKVTSLRSEEKEASISEQVCINTRVKADLGEAQTKIDELCATVKTMETEHQATYDASRNELSRMREKTADLTVSNEALLDKIQTYESRLKALQDQNQGFTNRDVERDALVQSLRKQLDRCAGEKTSSEGKISGLHASIERCQEENSRMSNNVQKAMSANVDLTAERDKLADQLKIKTRELRTLSDERDKTLKELSRKVDVLNGQKETIEKDRDATLLQLKEVEKGLKAVSAEVTEKEAVMMEQSLINANLESDLEDAESKTYDLIDEVENLKSNKQSMSTEMRKLREKVDTLSDNCLEAQEEISRLLAQKAEGVSRIEELSLEVSDASSQNALLGKEVQHLLEERKRTEDAHESKVKDLRNENRMALSRNSELSRRIQASEVQTKGLTRENMQLKNARRDAEMQMKELIETIGASKDQIDELFSDKLLLTEKLSDCAEEKEDLQNSNALLDEEKARAQRETKIALEKEQVLLADIEAIRERIRIMFVEKHDTEGRLAKMLKGKKEAEVRVAYLERQRFLMRFWKSLKSPMHLEHDKR